MDIKILFLIIIFVIHLAMATFLFLKSKGQPTRSAFALVLYGASLWTFGIAMFIATTNMEVAIVWARIYYFAAAVIPLAFLLFANHFIYPQYQITEHKIITWLLPFLAITVVIFHPTFFIEKVTHFDWGNDANVKFLGHMLYTIYFFTYIFVAYRILFKKLQSADGINRGILSTTITGTILSYLFGIFFDLLLPFIGIYRYIYLGPYFTLITLSFLVYWLFIKK